MDINRIKNIIYPAITFIAGYAVTLFSSYLKGGDNHYASTSTINNGGSFPFSAGGNTYVDARQADFLSMLPFMIACFAGGALVCIQQNRDAQRQVHTQGVQINTETRDMETQTYTQVYSQGVQANYKMRNVEIQQIDDQELQLAT